MCCHDTQRLTCAAHQLACSSIMRSEVNADQPLLQVAPAAGAAAAQLDRDANDMCIVQTWVSSGAQVGLWCRRRSCCCRTGLRTSGVSEVES